VGAGRLGVRDGVVFRRAKNPTRVVPAALAPTRQPATGTSVFSVSALPRRIFQTLLMLGGTEGRSRSRLPIRENETAGDRKKPPIQGPGASLSTRWWTV